jgi:type VI secretion system protein ImpF
VDHEIRVVASVLDRLIDLEPRSHRDVLPTRAESVRELRRAVQRDLDDLLNSRNTFSDLSPDFAEAGQSVLTYGLPDFSALNISSPRDQNRLRLVVEATIRIFEPRLTGIVATLTPPTPADRSLRLHVDARLVMDPSPQPVSFDIVMPLHTRKYEVKEGG